jgi:hypothetical protein
VGASAGVENDVSPPTASLDLTWANFFRHGMSPHDNDDGGQSPSVNIRRPLNSGDVPASARELYCMERGTRRVGSGSKWKSASVMSR